MRRALMLVCVVGLESLACIQPSEPGSSSSSSSSSSSGGTSYGCGWTRDLTGNVCTGGMYGICRVMGSLVCEDGVQKCMAVDANGQKYRVPNPGERPEVCGTAQPEDENCDGYTDEICVCVAGRSSPCGEDRGECVQGTHVCNADGMGYTECIGARGPSDEIPDGKDNDCDGATDEGFPCTPGAHKACSSNQGECTAGEQICGQDGEWGACSGVMGQTEICDGKDNDCDGQTDEGLLNACGACGPLPSEICNHEDDDCDGVTDEGCVGECIVGQFRACGTDEGPCKKGKEFCATNGQWSGTCEGGVPAVDEVCDGIDNDCNGEIDDNLLRCDCFDGDIQACGPSLEIGACKRGTQECINHRWAPCVGAVMAQAEVCDSADNNCDGQVDEGVKNACGTCGAVPVEVCDGIDNNCDQLTDEGLVGCDCQDGQQESCGFGTLGTCTLGVKTCTSHHWSVCAGAVMPATEICDSKDNDCDGVVDEGLLNRCGTCGPLPQEVCGDGIDNDCDGTVDNGCTCTPAAEGQPAVTMPCSKNVGICSVGTQTCTKQADGSGKWSVCSGVLPQTETCNGLDDNCDGQTDEGVKNACGTCGAVPAEVCDAAGRDENCNGQVNEGCTCTPGATRLCGNATPPCVQGHETCIRNADGTASWDGVCAGEVAPSPEVCDGVDNNCNGTTDEGVLNRCGGCGPVPAAGCPADPAPDAGVGTSSSGAAPDAGVGSNDAGVAVDAGSSTASSGLPDAGAIFSTDAGSTSSSGQSLPQCTASPVVGGSYAGTVNTNTGWMDGITAAPEVTCTAGRSAGRVSCTFRGLCQPGVWDNAPADRPYRLVWSVNGYCAEVSGNVTCAPVMDFGACCSETGCQQEVIADTLNLQTFRLFLTNNTGNDVRPSDLHGNLNLCVTNIPTTIPATLPGAGAANWAAKNQAAPTQSTLINVVRR